ncbi:gluconokinase, GntK/IdnK-type [Pseudomonas sp.]|uniref:gluconokinase, GntK/IdnK-type n=1 Tax=Pseudomonas sp. TaxID=306 RepID=UPI00289AA665|nr:gluconokinase, GntK/IdnK-type [Pseudomonas sp.]
MTSPVSTSATPAQALVIMGVSGSGKTETSLGVARCLGFRHIEADHFHSAENVARMQAGTPLTDADRIEWLDRLRLEMQKAVQDGTGFVLSCSALRRSYRDRLRDAVPGLRFAYLSVDYETALQRVGERSGHYMPTSLVKSQFDTLESPRGEPGVLYVDASKASDAVVQEVSAWMHAPIPSSEMAALISLASKMPDAPSPRSEPPLTSEPIYNNRTAQRFDKLTDSLMAILMAFMVGAVFVNVVLRYAFGSGWAGAEELSRLAFVWLIFVGVASSMRRGELMSFTLIRDKFPRIARRLVDSVSALLIATGSGLSAWGAWYQMQFGWQNASPVVGYPLAIAMLPVLVSMIALAVLALVQLLNAWRTEREVPPALANVTAD